MTPSLVQPLAPDVWVLLPEFSGQRTDLATAISFQHGQLLAVAQWSCVTDATIKRFAIGAGHEGIERVLTMARAAVEIGDA